MTDIERAAVLYDADCNICKTIMEALLTWDRRRRLRPVAIQSDEGQRLLHEIPEEKRLTSFHLARPGHPVVSGGPALAQLFEQLPRGAAVARALELSPRGTAAAYEWVARNRVSLSGLIPGAVKRRANRRLAARD
jgi:predicted DCC family thiol-disulfide oxidoreductase YuxK